MDVREGSLLESQVVFNLDNSMPAVFAEYSMFIILNKSFSIYAQISGIPHFAFPPKI
jgi:hypothetical protein